MGRVRGSGKGWGLGSPPPGIPPKAEAAGIVAQAAGGGTIPTAALPFEGSAAPAMAEAAALSAAATSASAGGLGEAAAESIPTGGLQPRGARTPLAVGEAEDEAEAEVEVEFNWE